MRAALTMTELSDLMDAFVEEVMMAKTIRIGPNKLTAKPLSPAPPRGMIPKPPPGQSNNPSAVKKAARGGKR